MMGCGDISYLSRRPIVLARGIKGICAQALAIAGRSVAEVDYSCRTAVCATLPPRAAGSLQPGDLEYCNFDMNPVKPADCISSGWIKYDKPASWTASPRPRALHIL